MNWLRTNHPLAQRWNWLAALLSTWKELCTTKLQIITEEALHTFLPRDGFLNRLMGQLCASAVTGKPYGRLTINRKAGCQQSVVTPPSRPAGRVLTSSFSRRSVSYLWESLCPNKHRHILSTGLFPYLMLHVSLWWGSNKWVFEHQQSHKAPQIRKEFVTFYPLRRKQMCIFQ